MAKTAVGGMSDWSGVLKETYRQIDDGSLTLENFIALNEHRNPFEGHTALLAEWKKFYSDLSGMECDFSSLVVPSRRKGFGRLLVIPDIKLETLYEKCKERFPCWRWTNDDLDKIVTWNERDAKNGAYAIWVKDVVEADENLKNLSANDIKVKGLTTETLAERLIHGLKFFAETRKHLDIRNITLCSGSRFSGGGVPNVNFNSNYDKVNVNRYDPDNSNDNLRSREKFSNKKSRDNRGFFIKNLIIVSNILSNRWSFLKFLAN